MAQALSLEDSRLAVILAQGLADPVKTAGEVLSQFGFIRTLGGVDAYLSIRSRTNGLSREQIDAEVTTGAVAVTPSVRGCIYLVDGSRAALSLRAADLLSRTRNERDDRKAGIKPGEVEKLAELVHKALSKHGPLSTDAVRKALPEGSVRSLGEAGKKVGKSSTLPSALRLLEFDGRVSRMPDGGRLDGEKYLWIATKQNPFKLSRVPDEPAQIWRDLAEIYYRTAAVGSIKDFADWAGISQRDAKAASASLLEDGGFVEVEVESQPTPAVVSQDLLDRLSSKSGRKAATDAVALLPFQDSVDALRIGSGQMVDPAFHGVKVPVWGRGKGFEPLGSAKYMTLRTIVADGAICGFWEQDPATGEVVTAPLGKWSASAAKRIKQLAKETGSFLTDQIGHAKSFSIDSEKAIADRAKFVRSMA